MVSVFFDYIYLFIFPDSRVNESDFKKEEWLFPETTINFNQLLIQYHSFCAYTFAVKDGLLLPGMPITTKIFLY